MVLQYTSEYTDKEFYDLLEECKSSTERYDELFNQWIELAEENGALEEITSFLKANKECWFEINAQNSIISAVPWTWAYLTPHLKDMFELPSIMKASEPKFYERFYKDRHYTNMLDVIKKNAGGFLGVPVTNKLVEFLENRN